MKIHGLQKMTLLDFPGRVACTVFLGGCDFRCPFCHNFELADGSAKPVMDEEELLAFLEKRRGLLDGVAITGGEPCLHAGLPALMERIRALGFAVKLDTNGTLPGRLAPLLSEGLVDYAAMDVKNTPEKYAATVGLPRFDIAPIRESMALLRGSGIPYEYRTTLVREFHTEADIAALAAWLRDEGAKRYFLQAFRDSGELIGENLHPVPRDEMFRMRDLADAMLPGTVLRGAD